MVSIYNRFIDWFLKREDGTGDDVQSPLALMQDIGDVHVLVADPDGEFANIEAKDALLEKIVIPLNERAGLSARRTLKSFQRASKGTLKDQFSAVLKDGRALLKTENADLLLWGKVEMEAQAVRWYFLSAIEGEANLGVPGFAESLLVPFEPEAGSLDVLYAAIFAACAPSHPSQAAKIGEYLLQAVDPLIKLPAGLNPRKTSQVVKTSTMGMGAVVLANIARRAKELGWFDPALKAFKTWESMVEKDKTPQEWALVNNHYGWLFEEMATHKDDSQALEHIEQSLRHFEGVCSVFTQKTYPLEWAAVQLRMAAMCARTGRSMNEPEYLQKAARYFKKSMDVYTQRQYPLNWADALSRMAKTLMLHGQMVKGAQSLEQAGVAFQAVLKVYTPEKYPAQWANTQNNLGATLFALAKRDPTTVAWIEHALGCFEEARAYYAENGKAKMAHVIDKNIQRAQSLKQQIEEDMASDLLN